MNAYQQRREARLLKAKKSREPLRDKRRMEVAAMIDRYMEAYNAQNGTYPTVRYINGRFYVGSAILREAELVKATDILWARVHERELNAPTED